MGKIPPKKRVCFNTLHILDTVLGILLTYPFLFLEQSCEECTLLFISIVPWRKLAPRIAVTCPIHPCLGGFGAYYFHFTVFQGPPPRPGPLGQSPFPIDIRCLSSLQHPLQVVLRLSACTRPGARNSLPPSAVHSLFRQHQQGRLLNSSSGSRQDVKRINKQISEWRGHLSPSCFFSLVLTLSFQITRITNIY